MLLAFSGYLVNFWTALTRFLGFTSHLVDFAPHTAFLCFSMSRSMAPLRQTQKQWRALRHPFGTLRDKLLLQSVCKDALALPHLFSLRVEKNHPDASCSGMMSLERTTVVFHELHQYMPICPIKTPDENQTFLL